MVKALPIEQVFDGSDQNILDVLNQATETQIMAGENWYFLAQNLAQDLAEKHDLEWQNVAAAIAALSPCLDWVTNVIAIREVIEKGKSRAQSGANNHKAREALKGDIGIINRTGKAKKVESFFNAIIDPISNENMAVCDRHAVSVFMGQKLTDKQLGAMGRVGAYEIVSNAYHEASKISDRPVHEIQAITWVVWRDLHDVDRLIGKS